MTKKRRLELTWIDKDVRPKLESEFTGKVKCIFIDPPYNTGSAFEHYDDGVEHSIWLG
jgi:16S rRNA G966 N2-methylase RsmD